MDSTVASLTTWMPRQRWYGGKGRAPELRLVASWDLPSNEPDVRVRTLLVADEASLPTTLYQVPVVARDTAAVDADAADIIGTPEPGTTLIDAPHDPAYARALLRMLTEGAGVTSADARAAGHPAPSSPAVTLENDAHVLTGEQSNTSIIFRPRASGAVPVICKVYRQLHAGLNPDIELQEALSAAGSAHVPPTIGSISGEWPDSTGTRRQRGSLAFAQQFLPEVEDAWRVALRAAASGEDFTERAHALGAATADVHLSLAQLFPTRTATPEDRAAVRASWQRRLRIAIAEVPGLADHRDAIEAVYDEAAAQQWPLLQRVHGDYHLGQVILVPDRGWVLLDFEGEPMRPMDERIRPDLATRDVAGMLRSFDYVAGSIRLGEPSRSPEAVRAWARAARSAFLEGYAHAAEVDVHGSLLNALELEKAVYEAIYEARNRPTWIAIPLRAIGRLSER